MMKFCSVNCTVDDNLMFSLAAVICNVPFVVVVDASVTCLSAAAAISASVMLN